MVPLCASDGTKDGDLDAHRPRDSMLGLHGHHQLAVLLVSSYLALHHGCFRNHCYSYASFLNGLPRGERPQNVNPVDPGHFIYLIPL